MVAMKLVSVAEMRAIEQEADSSGLTYAQMMENAGRGLAEIVLELPLDSEEEIHVLGLVGPGNNGGDTLVALAHLAAEGWKARAYLIKRKTKGDALIRRLEEAGGEIYAAEDDTEFATLVSWIEMADVVLDGVLGTGIKLPLKAEIAAPLEAAQRALAEQEWPPFVIAVDCPSGVDCDTGEAAEECLSADLTVTMAAAKQGLLRLPAFERVGELLAVDIGLSDDLASWKNVQRYVVEMEDVANILPARPADAHKGTFGTALIVAGSLNYTGAAMLAGKAAYRVGSGLVTLAVPAPLHGALAGQFPEATWLLLPHELGVIARDAADVLLENLNRPTAMLIGPGFGLEETTGEFIERLLSGKLTPKKTTPRIGFVPGETEQNQNESITLPPMVFDADGLKLLAKIKDWPTKLPPLTVLTPHPGEMSALTGLPKEEIQNNRQEIAEKYAREWGHVVVLKGAFTVIAAPDGRSALIPVATAALARAGTGDVLAGLIVGLRAQGVAAYEAALAAAWIHAQAGLQAAEALGNTAAVLAGDVLDAVSDVLSDLS
jgi:NAD(P)H-hydrate epimerase